MKNDDNQDIALVLEEFDKSETLKNSEKYNSKESNGTPRFKNKKVALP